MGEIGKFGEGKELESGEEVGNAFYMSPVPLTKIRIQGIRI